MEELFIKLCNRSIPASWLVLAVILFRVLLKNAPKGMRCVLWGLVAVRLICPFSFESMFSLIPSAEVIPQDIVYTDAPMIHTGVTALNYYVNPVLSESFAPAAGASVNPMQIVVALSAHIWAAGILGMLLYGGICYRKIDKRVAASLHAEDNLYLCDYIDAPFILGIIRPRIYIPSGLANEESAVYVIAHEKAHLRHHDHWWKPLGYLLLCVYWFNPVIWIGYILFCRDLELACDEAVIRMMGEQKKTAYSQALLACSIKMDAAGLRPGWMGGCPLAFGEVGVKSRVKEVLHYKKPAFWLVLLSLFACILAMLCFLTDPAKTTFSGAAPFGHSYRVEEVVYDDGRFSLIYTPEMAPEYQFTAEQEMLVLRDLFDETEGEMEGEMQVRKFGKFEEAELSEQNFDAYFQNGSDGPTSMIGPQKLRKITEKAWRIDLEDDVNEVFHYLILTKQGEVYLTYGYDTGEQGLANEDGSLIRWVFKLVRTDMLGMTYEEFGNMTGMDAEHMQANFYSAMIPGTELTAVFLAEGWDEEAAMAVLETDDSLIRLEGRLGALMNDLTEEVSPEEFIQNHRWSTWVVDSGTEEGAGTAYYVAERYVSITYDMDQDLTEDFMLQIGLNPSGRIEPDAFFWLNMLAD